jgi:TonB family protein
MSPAGTPSKRVEKAGWPAALALSLALHLLLWQALSWREKESRAPVDSLEIDLTRPFRLVSDPALARRAENPGAGAPLAHIPRRQDSLAPPPKPGASGLPETGAPSDAPPKEWVLPGPGTETLEKPGGDGGAGGLGGLGTGDGSGEVDWIYLTELPKILNRQDLLHFTRRFYPAPERLAGREGDVVLDVHLDPAGRVASVDVVTSAGADFDQAARKVISKARFSPAKVKERPVAVKIRQTVAFRLEN